jgi:hypothetical protein
MAPMAPTTKKGEMLVASRIGFQSMFVTAMGLFAFATQNVSASNEGPIGDQATISADSKVSSYIPLLGMDVAATIDSVDGKAIGAGTHKISVDPGIHTISLTCHAVGPTNTEEFDLSVLPGAHYQALAAVAGQRPVPCTTLIFRKPDTGKLEQVPVTYKVDSDGMYRFKQQGIAVWVPKECITDLAIYSHDRTVDFVANQTNWLANGQYAVKLTKIPKSVTNDISFIRETEPDAKDYVDDRPRNKLNLVLKEARRLDVDGQVGYRVVAVSEGKMVFVATFVLQKSWITIASLTYPLQPGIDAMGAIPWNCYNRFVESVKQME